MSVRCLLFALAVLPVLPAWSAYARVTGAARDAAEVEGIIFERQQIMEKLQRDGDRLGNIVAGLEPATGLPDVTRAIADGAKQSLEAYREKVPGGRTRAEAWSNNEDFMRRMDEFARNSEAMAVLGAKGDVIAVTGMLVDAMPCKQCHDQYRAPKTR